MIKCPKTKKEARTIKYGRWIALPNGQQYQEGHCAFEVWDRVSGHQCLRKNGYGPGGLYCKQHSKKLLLMAEKLGRTGVGLDLSSEYLWDIARGKIEAPMQKELF